MTCQYLIGTYLNSCAATHDVYIPSRFEFNEYCRGAFHTLCPLFRVRHSQGWPITERTGEGPDRSADSSGRSRSPLLKI